MICCWRTHSVSSKGNRRKAQNTPSRAAKTCWKTTRTISQIFGANIQKSSKVFQNQPTGHPQFILKSSSNHPYCFTSLSDLTLTSCLQSTRLVWAGSDFTLGAVADYPHTTVRRHVPLPWRTSTHGRPTDAISDKKRPHARSHLSAS